MMRWLLACCVFFWPVSALAIPIIADISSHKIEIHSGFTGTQLLLFGARNEPGDIIVAIRGPEHDLIIRKKERIAGLWVNRNEKRFDHTPHYYAVSSSKELGDVRQQNLFAQLGIDSPVRPLADTDEFHTALNHILGSQGLYSDSQGEISFMGETLFKAVFNFPDNLPRGTYLAETYLISDGMLSGVQIIPVQVFKTGFDAFLYDAAHRYSLWYGLFCVTLAVSSGWFANWLFRRL